MCGIYKITNLINGKVYIGQTKQSLKTRWANGKGYKNCTAFNYAIEKYGWNNFDHIVLEEELSKDEADIKEQYYIHLYHSTDKDFGYNITDGGGGLQGTGRSIYQYDMDGNFIRQWRSVIDICNYFNVSTDGGNIYACCNGKIDSAYGYQWKYDKKKKIKNVLSKGEKIAQNKSIEVYMYDMEGCFIRHYNSMKSVEQDGFNFKLVSACCNGKRKSTGGYQWRNEYFENIEPYVPQTCGQKTVYQYSLDNVLINVYQSVKEASSKTGIDFKLISSACLGKNATSKGYIWSYSQLSYDAN